MRVSLVQGPLLFPCESTERLNFSVVETHPESLIDLRIHSPFPSLIEYANTFDYAAMDSEQHGHIPAVVILVKALEEWRAAVRTLCCALARSSVDVPSFISTVVRGQLGHRRGTSSVF